MRLATPRLEYCMYSVRVLRARLKMAFTIQLTYGRDKLKVELPAGADSTVSELKDLVTATTGIPIPRQKIIFKGKTLQQDEMTLQELKVTNNSKMILLGRKVEENGEQSAREISKIGKAVDDIERKIDEIEKEVDGIEKGYLSKEQIAGACQGLNKRCVTCNEHLMQNTMKLDAVDIPPSETIIRASRKTAVQRIQILLERSDSLEARVAQCIAGSAEKKVTKTRSMNSLRTGQTQSKTEQTDSTSDKAGRSRRKKK